jgi:membrane associated rhomboid family serine protease
VAFWAHVAGFVAGMVLGPVLRRRPREPELVWRH